MTEKYAIKDVPRDLIRDLVREEKRRGQIDPDWILVKIIADHVVDASRYVDLETGEARVAKTPEVTALADHIRYQIDHL